MSDLLRAVRQWLPYHVYRFIGGPFDGQDIEVRLIETELGSIAPDVWNIAEPLPPPVISDGPVDAYTEMVPVHRYRFVPDAGRINVGHYRWIAP